MCDNLSAMFDKFISGDTIISNIIIICICNPFLLPEPNHRVSLLMYGVS